MACNPEQQQILNRILSSSASFVLVQGKAGSGKSYLIRELWAQTHCTILVPTNMAKSVYPQAVTMHSFFWGEFDDLEEGYQNSKAEDVIDTRLFQHKSAEDFSIVFSDICRLCCKNDIAVISIRNAQCQLWHSIMRYVN